MMQSADEFQAALDDWKNNPPEGLPPMQAWLYEQTLATQEKLIQLLKALEPFLEDSKNTETATTR